MTDPDDRPRWLDEDEMATWFSLVQVLIRLPGALDRQLRAESGMTHLQYTVLVLLSAAGDEGLSMSDIADAAAVEISRLSHVARGLEDRGLVSRTPAPHDRRVQVARITEGGVHALEEAAPGHVRLVRALVVDRLTPSDLRDLRRIGNKVVDALNEVAPLSPQSPFRR